MRACLSALMPSSSIAATQQAVTRWAWMELTPRYRAERLRQQVRDAIDLALKATSVTALALLIDTAIESRRGAKAAEDEARRLPTI